MCQDITFCMSQECDRIYKCHRFVGCRKRIASYSDFADICNKETNYPYYIEADEYDIQRYKEKRGIKG